MPTFGSLFAGIGGMDVGLERAGWECRFQVERDAYCQRVLARHWPDVPRYGDIAAVDWSTLERVDLLAGGFPCQPVSNAGRRAGQADARWLWPEFARAVRDLRPRYVFVENVAALRVRGLGDVLGDLAALGYDAEWDCIPASAVGAPHQRDRLWLVAHAIGIEPGTEQQRVRDAAQRGGSAVADPNRDGRPQLGLDAAADGVAPLRDDPHRRRGPLADPDGHGGSGRGDAAVETTDGRPHATAAGRGDGRGRAVADAVGAGLERPFRIVMAEPPSGRPDADPARPDRRPAEPGVGRGPDGLPAGLDGHRWPASPGVPQHEWEPARIVAPRTVANRNARLHALGNAVVPQVVETIGRRLLEAHKGRCVA